MASTRELNVFTPLFLSGLSLGVIYAIVALGFVVLFKATAVLNFAHGAFLMLATYLALTITSTFGFGFLPTLALVSIAMAGLGVAIHYGVMRWMVGKAFFSIVLVTVGMEILIRAVLLVLYGPNERGRLTDLPAGAMEVFGVRLSYTNLGIMVVAIGVVVAFLAFFRFTRMGLHMRALADDLEAAAAQGINPHRIYATAWAIAMVTAGIGGLLYGHYATSINLDLSAIGLRAFPAAILGGLDSVGGAILGGILVGLIETIGSGYLGAEWRSPLAFGVMILVLLWRPSGLLGTRDVVRV